MIADHDAKCFAWELTRRRGGDVDRISQSLFDAGIDLNPHQFAVGFEKALSEAPGTWL